MYHKEKVIGCNISGGLGNQFFRYAIARRLFEDNKTKGENYTFIMNTDGLDNHGVRGNIYDFNIINHQKCNTRRLIFVYGNLCQKSLYICYSVINKLSLHPKIYTVIIKRLKKALGSKGIVISENPDDETLYLPTQKLNKLFTYGSFEKYSYFSSIKEILKKEFKPTHPTLESNKKLYSIISSTNSVCLAVRRGDFLIGNNKKIFHVCDNTYFEEAIKYIKEKIDNPTFIVFSNDIEWVKEKIIIDAPTYYESGKDPVWETFRLMYSCKHFIISNSTMHWWAQFMSNNEDKIVVAPDRWYNAPGWEEHLMMDNFIRIKTGVKNPFKKPDNDK